MKRFIYLLVFSCLIILVPGCRKMFVPEPANDPEAIFENLWTTFNEEYAPFEERHVDWNQLYSVYRPQVNKQTGDQELFTILSNLLSHLDDGHVSLTAPGREMFFSNHTWRNRIGDSLFDRELVKLAYLENGFKTDREGSYIYGKVKNENVAYIFFDHVGANFFRLNDFLNAYPDVSGFIIDMRHNQGGDFTFCFTEMGRLTNLERYVFRSRTRNGKEKDDYTAWYNWSIRPSGAYVNKPIVVLTDRFTISAGERSVMAFGTLPNVTVMGDTTNGAHGTMIGRELANGWFYSVVPQKVELHDGKSYEGIGLAPDVYFQNKMADMRSGKDRLLEKAIDRLK